jgi:hypothetical protein
MRARNQRRSAYDKMVLTKPFKLADARKRQTRRDKRRARNSKKCAKCGVGCVRPQTRWPLRGSLWARTASRVIPAAAASGPHTTSDLRSATVPTATASPRSDSSPPPNPHTCIVRRICPTPSPARPSTHDTHVGRTCCPLPTPHHPLPSPAPARPPRASNPHHRQTCTRAARAHQM